MAQTFIIAEAGVNHNAQVENAFKLIEIAKAAKADAVKFQIFKEGECTGKFATKVNYLEKTSRSDETRYEITRKLILNFEDFAKIKEHADNVGIEFIATPDGEESLNYLADKLQVKRIKIASTEVTNLPFLEMIARKNVETILSTGLSNLGEVEIAVNRMMKINKNLKLLHCVSEYPAPIEDLNLKAIQTMQKAFNLDVGFSDHSLGYEASMLAVGLGATILEKHFTIDKKMEGPDHQASLEPHELTQYVNKIREAELMLGSGSKKPSNTEIKNMQGIRRGLVAKGVLKKGTILAQECIAIKRPSSGIHPYDIDKVIGFKLNTDLQDDEPITWNHLK